MLEDSWLSLSDPSSRLLILSGSHEEEENLNSEFLDLAAPNSDSRVTRLEPIMVWMRSCPLINHICELELVEELQMP